MQPSPSAEVHSEPAAEDPSSCRTDRKQTCVRAQMQKPTLTPSDFLFSKLLAAAERKKRRESALLGEFSLSPPPRPVPTEPHKSVSQEFPLEIRMMAKAKPDPIRLLLIPKEQQILGSRCGLHHLTRESRLFQRHCPTGRAFRALKILLALLTSLFNIQSQ